MKIGFVGLGRMGSAMAARIAVAGHSVTGYDPAPGAPEVAASRGIVLGRDVGALADSDVVLSSLPDSHHVQDTYLREGGLLAQLREGAVCLDLSTIAPSVSVECAVEAAERGIGFLDAPVNGTVRHAEAGELAVFVGGSRATLDSVRPVLSAFAQTVHHVGGHGDGLRLKLVSNQLINAHVAAIAEAVVHMESLGLDARMGVDILKHSSVPRLLEYKSEPLLTGDYQPSFTTALMLKDLGILAGETTVMPVSRRSNELLRQAAEQGYLDQDFAALMESLPR